MSLSIFGDDDTMGFIWRNARQSPNVEDLRGNKRVVLSNFQLYFEADLLAYSEAVVAQDFAGTFARAGYFVYSLSVTSIGDNWWACTVDLLVGNGVNTGNLYNSLLPDLFANRYQLSSRAEVGGGLPSNLAYGFAPSGGGDGGSGLDWRSLASFFSPIDQQATPAPSLYSFAPAQNAANYGAGDPTTMAVIAPTKPASMSNGTILLIAGGILFVLLMSD